MAIKVLINGTDRTDLLYYQATTQWNLMRGQRGTCMLPFIIEPGNGFTPRIGEAIEIYDPVTTRVWCGSVDSAAIRWLGDDGWRVTIATGVSLEQLFDTAELDKYKITGITAGAALQALYDESGVTAVTLGTVDDGVTIESLEVTNIAQGFDQLALLAGFVWYIDPVNKQLYFHAPDARAADWTVGSNDVLWETLDWRQSRQDFRNEQVVQLPGVTLAPAKATFDGDGSTTNFNLPTVPDYILSIDLTLGRTDKTIHWNPGTTLVTCYPAPQTGSTLVVRYAETGTVTVVTDSPGIGNKSARFTRTRSFTQAGGLQMAQALLARYSLLPSELVFSTDKPGIGIGRKLTIDLDEPLESGALLNGNWMVRELEASIVPGLEKRAEPFGHFRYTAHLINTAASAVFQGDDETESFLLPVVPSEVTSIRPDIPEHHLALWVNDTNEITVTPPLASGEGMTVDYIDPNGSPYVAPWTQPWEEMSGGGELPPISGGGDEEDSSGPDTFVRVFTIYDSTVRDDAAPHTTVYRIGVGWRILGVLRKIITSDLTVRFNKEGEELLTVTIPSGAGVDDVLEWPLQEGSPATYIPFFDKEVLTADILESDGSTDADSIAQFTIQWAVSGRWVDFTV